MFIGILQSLENSLESVFENYRFDTWYSVILSVLCWALLYFAIKGRQLDQSPEYYSRVVTLCHGLFISINGMTECFAKELPFNNPDAPTTPFQAYLIVVSLGYFIVDLSWCLFYQSETFLMIAHHVYSCIALCRMLFKGYSGNQATCALGGLEITNPLLQTRWFLRSYGYADTPIFTSVELTFILIFFLVRIVAGTYLMLIIVLNPKNDLEFTSLTIVIYIMSWMFMINITKFVYFKYLKGNINESLPQTGTG